MELSAAKAPLYPGLRKGTNRSLTLRSREAAARRVRSTEGASRRVPLGRAMLGTRRAEAGSGQLKKAPRVLEFGQPVLPALGGFEILAPLRDLPILVHLRGRPGGGLADTAVSQR